jgi:hypothetical protein
VVVVENRDDNEVGRGRAANHVSDRAVIYFWLGCRGSRGIELLFVRDEPATVVDGVVEAPPKT